MCTSDLVRDREISDIRDNGGYIDFVFEILRHIGGKQYLFGCGKILAMTKQCHIEIALNKL